MFRSICRAISAGALLFVFLTQPAPTSAAGRQRPNQVVHMVATSIPDTARDSEGGGIPIGAIILIVILAIAITAGSGASKGGSSKPTPSGIHYRDRAAMLRAAKLDGFAVVRVGGMDYEIDDAIEQASNEGESLGTFNYKMTGDGRAVIRYRRDLRSPPLNRGELLTADVLGATGGNVGFRHT
jgi:hypothetical protein